MFLRPKSQNQREFALFVVRGSGQTEKRSGKRPDFAACNVTLDAYVEPIVFVYLRFCDFKDYDSSMNCCDVFRFTTTTLLIDLIEKIL